MEITVFALSDLYLIMWPESSVFVDFKRFFRILHKKLIHIFRRVTKEGFLWQILMFSDQKLRSV